MEEENNQVSIDIGELTKSVKAKMEILRPLLDTSPISRAPKRLRLLNRDSFVPRLVSIGPYHHGLEELKVLEEHKKRYLQSFLQRSNVNLEDLVAIVAKNERKLRNCYAEIVNMSSHEFVEMIMLDAIFIIEFLISLHGTAEDSFIINKSGFSVATDMCLLENQIPLFILEDLFKLHVPSFGVEAQLCFRDVVLSFCKYIRYSFESSNEEEIGSSREVKHLLDFVRVCSMPSSKETGRSSGILNTTTMPTATELHQAGVKFQSRPNTSMFEIKFSNGILEIPPITITNDTEILVHNMLALEQGHNFYGTNFFNDYFGFIISLAPSPDDVTLLVRKGIIDNAVSHSKRISEILARLAYRINIHPYRFYYTSLVEDLRTYCEIRRHKWKATLKQNYFSNPWSIISVIAAGFLLILTVIQSVCSILQL